YAELAGVALPVSARCGKARFDNALLITHRGLSGPSILQISSYWEPGRELLLDLLPGVDAEDFLLSQQRARPSAELSTVLADALPRRLAQRLCEVFFRSRPMQEIPAAELRTMAAQLKRWTIVASGTEGYRTAEVTLAGVDTRELSSTSMQSSKHAGLFFIGEVVDVTGHLGGYNFQWAWASGNAAGQVA
ncbi:MAG: NAD(P)/FAD-dependent oxidoreductase, partial [Arenimonas sp.]